MAIHTTTTGRDDQGAVQGSFVPAGADPTRTHAALQLLDTAHSAGAPTAMACADSLSPDPTTQADAQQRLLAAADENGDAMNFLGIAAFTSDKLDLATGWWTRSA